MTLCLVLTLGLVQSSPLETYKRGKELFDASYFEQAAPLLSMFIEDPGSAPAAKITGARWMLAQALFFTHDTKGAAKQVRVLLQKSAAIPDDLPPPFLAFVEDQKKAMPAPHAPMKPPPRPTGTKEPNSKEPNTKPAEPAKPTEPVKAPDTAPEPRRAPPDPVPPPLEVAPEPRSPEAPAALQLTPEGAAARELPPMPGWYLRGLPAGVGHFIAKDYVGGGVFLALTLLTAAANIALVVLNTRALGPDGTFAKSPQYPALYIAQYVTAGAFYGALAASLIDGIAFVPRRVAEKWAP